MEYRRTAVIKLDVPQDADASLRETVEQFKHCANTASEWCWHGDDGYHVTSKAKAERVLYDQLRDETDLTANLVQKGVRRAVEAVKSGVARLKCGYQNHADYNAAKNIGFRYLRRRQNAADGGAPVDVRLNCGTLNVSGEYVPPAITNSVRKT